MGTQEMHSCPSLLIFLPEEILENILIQIRSPSDVISFVLTCSQMYRIFKRLRIHDLDEIRVEYLNQNIHNINNNSEWSDLIEPRKKGSRLIELFSRGSSRNMWTYDEYFKCHSPYSWPSSCFKKGITYTSTVLPIDEESVNPSMTSCENDNSGCVNESNDSSNRVEVSPIQIKQRDIEIHSSVEEDYRFYPNEGR